MLGACLILVNRFFHFACSNLAPNSLVVYFCILSADRGTLPADFVLATLVTAAKTSVVAAIYRISCSFFSAEAYRVTLTLISGNLEPRASERAATCDKIV